jgi:hypothetical protein
VADNPKKGARANVVAMGKADDELAAQRQWKLDTAPMDPRGPDHVAAGQWKADLWGMPADAGCECPVEPIGFEGGIKYFIDSMGQFRAIKAAELNQVGIQDLFSAAPNYPKWMCPRWSKPVVDKKGIITKPSEIVSFEADDIKEILFRACARKGFFSPSDKMRGRGAWTLRSGQIVYHAGDSLWITQGGRFTKLPTGVHHSKLYPRLSALPRPWTEPIGMDENPAPKLLETFRKWNWTRPDVDPVLLLGWIGCAMIGGALDWRSAVLLLGDRATGKSTLQKALWQLFGDTLFRSADTTAAGIYQGMAHDSRPVALDELEPDADPRKLDNTVHLMRTSASGDIGRRGGPTKGEASEFQMRSAFLFSAINNPLRSAQDMSRVAVLRLLPLNLNQERPAAIDGDKTGPQLLALMLQGWGPNGATFAGELERFKAALAIGGHGGRGQDTYGTLLACAATLLGPELSAELEVPLGPDDERKWSTLLAADALPEVEDAKPNYRQCVDKILTTPVAAWRNVHRNTIGETIHQMRTTDDDGKGVDQLVDLGTAKRDIQLAGFGLFTARELVAHLVRSGTPQGEALLRFGLRDGLLLAIPNSSVKVAKHLEGTEWQHGAWKDALRQCPIDGVMIKHAELNNLRVDGVKQRCTLVALDRYHEAPER